MAPASLRRPLVDVTNEEDGAHLPKRARHTSPERTGQGAYMQLRGHPQRDGSDGPSPDQPYNGKEAQEESTGNTRAAYMRHGAPYFETTTSPSGGPGNHLDDNAEISRVELFDGMAYDYVFEVDLTDGPPLKLFYNMNEHPSFAAERFLEENQLDPSLLDAVVDIVHWNIAQENIGSNDQDQDPFTSSGQYRPGQPANASGSGNYVDPFTGAGAHRSSNVQQRAGPGRSSNEQAHVLVYASDGDDDYIADTDIEDEFVPETDIDDDLEDLLDGPAEDLAPSGSTQPVDPFTGASAYSTSPPPRPAGVLPVRTPLTFKQANVATAPKKVQKRKRNLNASPAGNPPIHSARGAYNSRPSWIIEEISEEEFLRAAPGSLGEKTVTLPENCDPLRKKEFFRAAMRASFTNQMAQEFQNGLKAPAGPWPSIVDLFGHIIIYGRSIHEDCLVITAEDDRPPGVFIHNNGYVCWLLECDGQATEVYIHRSIAMVTLGVDFEAAQNANVESDHICGITGCIQLAHQSLSSSATNNSRARICHHFFPYVLSQNEDGQQRLRITCTHATDPPVPGMPKPATCWHRSPGILPPYREAVRNPSAYFSNPEQFVANLAYEPPESFVARCMAKFYRFSMVKTDFRLSASLTGHKADVRSVLAPSPDHIVSASRDGTAISWLRAPEGSFAPNITYHAGERYVNALAWVPPAKEASEGLVATGGQEAIINLFPPSSSEPTFALAHEGNVCALHVAPDGTIISGSSDSTARVWRNFEEVYTLKGHTQAVCAVLALGNDRYLTASEDHTIILWNGSQAVHTYEGHGDAVRGLVAVDGLGFASCSDDADVRVWSLNGECLHVLSGHTSLVYSLAATPSGLLLSSSEDRTVRVWRDEKCAQIIAHPNAVWSVVAMPNGDFVTGASDGVVRVFSEASERWASEEDLKTYDAAVRASAKWKGKALDLPGREALDARGRTNGQVKYIDLGGVAVAFEWSSGNKEWQKVKEHSAESDAELAEHYRKGAVRRAPRKWCEQTRPFPCDIPGCDRTFQSPGAVAGHKVDHQVLDSDGTWKYKCKSCSKLFSETNLRYEHDLKDHKRINPVQCDVCGEYLAWPVMLRRHMLKHTGEKPHPCTHPGCSSAFVTKGELKSHLRTHNDERPFKCTVEGCSYAAKRKVNLMQHGATHVDPRRFPCPWEGCNYAAKKEKNLNNHIQRKHGE